MEFKEFEFELFLTRFFFPSHNFNYYDFIFANYQKFILRDYDLNYYQDFLVNFYE